MPGHPLMAWSCPAASVARGDRYGSGAEVLDECYRSAVIPNLSAMELSLSGLREVTGYAMSCALPALEIFEHAYSNDKRPRLAIEAAAEFVDGAKRSAALRNSA